MAEHGVQRQEDGVGHHGGHAEVAEEVVLQVGERVVRLVGGDGGVAELVVPVLRPAGRRRGSRLRRGYERRTAEGEVRVSFFFLREVATCTRADSFLH